MHAPSVIVVGSREAEKVVRRFASTFAIQCGLLAVFCLLAYEALGLRRSRAVAMVLLIGFAAAGGYFEIEIPENINAVPSLSPP